MKFTEGYWLRSERSNALYASQAYSVERIENGTVVESVTEDSAVWELMYFGKAGADKK